MRSLLSLPALLLVAALAAAQPGAPAQDPNKDKMLDFVLANWEKAMTGLSSFSAECVRTTVDKGIGGTEVFTGHAKFLKSGPGQPSRALLELAKRNQPERFEKFLVTGTFLYEYVPARKVIVVHDMPPPKPGQVGEDNFLTFLFGMKADDAKKRYQMQFVPDDKGQNKWYYYLRIIPRTPQDKADFAEARLTLSSKDFMPRQLWYHQPNGNEMTWDFPKVDVNGHIPLTAFDPPRTPPSGWRVERAPAQGRPASPNPAPGFPVGNKK